MRTVANCPVGRALAAAAALALLGGCGEPDATPESSESDIIDGTADDSDPAVVAVSVVTDQYKRICSGTVVSPHVVMTAAHCFLPALEGDHLRLWVIRGDDADTPWPWRWYSAVPADTVTHPDYIEGYHLGGSDIAAVITESAIDATPLPMNRLPMTSSDVGTPVRFVGFGQTDANDRKSTGRKNQVTLSITNVDADRFSSNAATGHICGGDSGGPGLIQRDGVDYVAGINSYAELGCVGTNTSTRVDAFAASFMDAIVAQHDPDYVPPGSGTP